MIRISIDGGGGFLKICTPAFETDNPIVKMNGALLKKFLEVGVKNISIIVPVPDVCEDYVNVKQLWMNCVV